MDEPDSPSCHSNAPPPPPQRVLQPGDLYKLISNSHVLKLYLFALQAELQKAFKGRQMCHYVFGTTPSYQLTQDFFILE